ncbi:DUF551 domain-containing protein [Salmonella enterica]|nr:DUF551 domain-containing protein [Salmonella enterica]
MTTITRERLLKIQQWRETYGTGSNVMPPAEEAEELARIALASLEAEPVSQTYNLPELIEGMEVSIDVSTCDADAGNRYFGTVTEVSELYTAKNGYILLVQDAKPNFDVNGNTPVQSPIDHGYRPECECSGCKATARICAELNNEEAEIFADGYNAAMLKVNKNASTELPNDANLSTSSQAEPDDSGLLPCPFCGSPAEHYPDGDMEGYIIMCGNKNGDCNLQTFGFTTPEEAEKAWNTRAAIPQTGNFRENPISSTNNFRKIADTSTNSPAIPDGWISCSERMPAQDDWVLLYSKYGEYLAGQVQGEYMELNDGTLSWLGSALHWMLLPEPPQEVK